MIFQIQMPLVVVCIVHACKVALLIIMNSLYKLAILIIILIIKGNERHNRKNIRNKFFIYQFFLVTFFHLIFFLSFCVSERVQHVQARYKTLVSDILILFIFLFFCREAICVFQLSHFYLGLLLQFHIRTTYPRKFQTENKLINRTENILLQLISCI